MRLYKFSKRMCVDKGEKRINNPKVIPMFRDQGDEEKPAKFTLKKCAAIQEENKESVVFGSQGL